MSSLTLELQATWSELPQVRNSVPPSRTHSNLLTSLMVHLLYILVKRSTLCPETQTTSPLRVWSWRTLMFRYLQASFSWKSMTCEFDQPNINCELVTPQAMSADPKPMQTEMNTCPSQTPKFNSNLAWGVY